MRWNWKTATALLLATLCLAVVATLVSTHETAGSATPISPAVLQAHLDQTWAQSDWVGIIATLEPLQQKGWLVKEHRDALYAAYINEGTILVRAGASKEAEPLAQKAKKLISERTEADALLARIIDAQ